ncbi:MAG: hypothetical protein IT580_01635 [Verrucomicrobiales bacterium]|nr:hypothetical protein [Verrucomicrobiales bacterium]
MRWILFSWLPFLTAAAIAQSGIGYLVQEVPLDPRTWSLLNDKDQVVVLNNGVVQIYQPAPDYGRTAGVHSLGNLRFIDLIQFNNRGTLLGRTTNGPMAYQGGQSFLIEGVAYSLNNVDQINGQRPWFPPGGGESVTTHYVTTPGGPYLNAADVLRHGGIIGRDAVYVFNEINDAGVAAGGYAEREHLFAVSRNYMALWETGSSYVRTLPGNGAVLINNKGQALGIRRTPGGANEWFLYLPQADYGMKAGYHTSSIFTTLNGGSFYVGSELTDHGEVFLKLGSGLNTASYPGLWYRGRLVNPSKQLTDGNVSDLTQIHDVNNHGVILGAGSLNGRPGRLLLYRPAISATITFEPEVVELGKTFKMNVTISNETSENFVLAGVLGESYKVSGTGLPGLQQLENPPPTRSLPAGSSWTQIFPFRVTQPGEIQFSLKATGSHAGGRRFLTDTIESKPVQVVAELVSVDVQVDPPAVDLEEDTRGEPIFQEVTATLTITNLHDGPLENVEISSFTARALDVPPPVPAAVVVVSGPFNPANPSAPVPLGTLPKGGTLVRTYKLRAQARGDVEMLALIRAKNPYGANRLSATGRRELKVRQDLLLVFDAHQENIFYRKATPVVLGGNSWRVVGTLKNRSKDQTLLVQLTPELSGNAFYAQPIPDGTSAPDEQCACGLLQTIPADEEVSFRAPVRTLTTGGTRGKVVYRPKVWIKADDGSVTLIHDERRGASSGGALKDDRVVVTDGSQEHAVSVDTSDEAPRQPFADEVVGHFLVGTVDGLGNLAEGIGSTIATAAEMLAEAGAPWEWPEAAMRSMMLGTGYLVETYYGLTETERQQFLTDLRSDLRKYLEVPPAVYDQIIASFNTKVADLTFAWETGDSAKIAHYWGELAGENPDVAIGFAFGICKLAGKGSRFAARGLEGFRASQAATAEARIAAGAKKLKPWDALGRSALTKIFGIDDASHRAFKKLTAKGFVLAVRRRGAGTIAKLKTGLYVTKPYHIKAKNVSALDIDWLGFPGDKLDEVVLKAPPAWPDVEKSMRAAFQEPDLIAEVRLRWETRAKEWWGKGVDDFGNGGDLASSERAAWQRMNESKTILYNKQSVEGLVDNFDKGYAIPPDDLLQVPKHFEVVEGPNGSLIPKIEGKLVTGDIDPMYIGKADGSGWRDLTDDERLEVYRLFRELGLQHPESRTWRNFKVNEYFQEFSIHNPNRDALAMYLPDGRTVAAFFDPGKSWQESGAWRNMYMFFRGGVTLLNSSKPAVGELAASLQEEIRLAQEPRPVYIAPGTWALVSPDCPGSQLLALRHAAPQCSAHVTVSNGDEALVLRQPSPGELERWTPELGWQPFEYDRLAVTITPQTVLTAYAEAGDAILQITDPASLGLRPDGPWFEAGQTIVINPGGANEESAVIRGFGSLLLEAPLRFTHEPRELVVALPTQGGQSRPRFSVTSAAAGTPLTLQWTDATGRFLLEESENLADWRPSPLPIQTTGDQRKATAPVEENERFYRLRRPAAAAPARNRTGDLFRD